MARVDRMLIGLPLLALVLVVLGRMRAARDEVAAAPEHATVPPASPSSASSEQRPTERTAIDADLGRFLDGLGRVRRAPGEIDAAEKKSLEELGERLCATFDRCDVRGVLAYYLRLTPDERRIGLEEEARCEELRQAVLAAAKNGMDELEWGALREQLLAGLRAIASRARTAADFVPAGRALSLSARLEMERIQRTPAQDEESADEVRLLVEDEAREALALYERAGFLRPQLEPIWVLASLDFAGRNTVRARAGFEQCIRLAQRVGDLDYQEKGLAGLILIDRDAGDVVQERRWIHDLARFRSPKESWELARRHADYLLQLDETRAAVDFLTENPPIDSRERSQWHVHLAGAWLRLGDRDQVREHLALVREDPSTTTDLELLRCDLALEEGASFEVIDRLIRPEFQARLSRLAQARAQALIGRAFVQMDRPDAAIEPLESALAIGARWQTRLESQRRAPDAVTSVFGEEIGLEMVALLAACHAQTGDAPEVARVIEQYQSSMLRGALAATSADSSAPSSAQRGPTSTGVDRSAPVLAYDDLKAWASAFDLGLVTWVVGADSSVVAYVARDGSARAEPIARGRIRLEAAVRRLREAVIAGDDASIARLARETRAAILPDPIFDALRGDAHGRLLCLLHGPLEKLPIELLFDVELGNERIVPLVLPGLPARAPGEPLAPAALTEWTLEGDPIDRSGAARLPGAREEILAIARLRGSHAEARVGSVFDREALASALGGRRALHVATHLARRAEDYGRFDALGLRLSNGDVFEAREISAARPALPLAVLAACETAEGRFIDAEGLQGVARAFLESGTRNLLVTLWPIADQAGLQFSLEFHRALIAGAKPSEAAAMARRALRDHGFPPADWAAFRLLGRD